MANYEGKKDLLVLRDLCVNLIEKYIDIDRAQYVLGGVGNMIGDINNIFYTCSEIGFFGNQRKNIDYWINKLAKMEQECIQAKQEDLKRRSRMNLAHAS